MTDTNYSELFRDMAEQQRWFASLANCDEARNDHLTWAYRFDRLADAFAIDYLAITRTVAREI